MSTDFQRQRFTFRSLKKLATTSFLSVVLAVQVLAGTAIAQTVPPTALAPVRDEGAVDVIPDQYIVVFKTGTSRETVQQALSKVKAMGGSVGFTYQSALVGFSAKLSPKALDAVRAFGGVDYIERDQKLTLDTVQSNPPQGLDRTSERLLPLDQRYTYSKTGLGVHVYVIDRGIDITHSEFAGRTLGNSVTFVNDGYGYADCPAANATGVIGHGTFVAGIIGGTTVGIAKQVTLHSVRVADCTGSVASNATLAAGIDWVTANATRPAVTNISVGSGASTAINFAVRNAVAANITVVVSAGNGKTNACQRSPAGAPEAITVGAINPSNDTLWQNPNVSTIGSNFGPCVDLFAPGFNILSADISSSTATRLDQGTSFAAPHVAGVAALYLQNHTSANPAAVWAAIHNADDVATTAGWAGIINLPANTANELLHWGSLNDGFNDGDPHLTTVDGVHYDFQSAGEFVALRDGNGLQIQTRQTPVATTPWVSVNTAIAARVGKHRVTWQPNISGVPDPSGLQFRVDGVLTTIGENGLDLGSGGRVVKSIWDGIEIYFPDGTALFVTSNWWANQSQWYLNVHVFHTPATEGIMGVIEPNSWLQEQFANTWRVTDKTSLFDYAPNKSTETFTLPIFPKEKIPAMKPQNVVFAQNVCGEIVDENMKKDCVFDVSVTGDPIFAKSSLVSQMIQNTVKGRQSPNVIPSDPCKRHARWWQHFWPWNSR